MPPPEAVLIRRARMARGLKPPQVALAAGISPSRLAQIEAGQENSQGRPARAPAETLARLAAAVGVTPAELTGLPAATPEDKARLADAAGILERITRPEPEPGHGGRADLRRQLDEARELLDAVARELDPDVPDGPNHRKSSG